MCSKHIIVQKVYTLSKKDDIYSYIFFTKLAFLNQFVLLPLWSGSELSQILSVETLLVQLMEHSYYFAPNDH